MKRLNTLLFVFISAGFAAVMLVMGLYRTIELAAVCGRISRTQEKMQITETENRVLSTRLENKLSLQNIDSAAREKLGMRPPAAEQIYFIDYPG